jgi:hypothetical protein
MHAVGVIIYARFYRGGVQVIFQSVVNTNINIIKILVAISNTVKWYTYLARRKHSKLIMLNYNTI